MESDVWLVRANTPRAARGSARLGTPTLRVLAPRAGVAQLVTR